VVKSFYAEIESTLSANADRIRLRLPSGDTPAFTSNTAVTITWLSRLATLGGTTGSPFEVWFRNQSSVARKPARIVSDYRQFYNSNAYVFAIDYLNANYTDQSLALERKMAFTGAGDIYSMFDNTADANGYSNTLSTKASGHIQHAFCHRYGYNTSMSTGGSIYVDPQVRTCAPGTVGSGFGVIAVTMTGAPASAYALAINSSSGVIPGTECEIILENYGDGVEGLNVTLTWDSTFIFSDPSDAQLGPAANLTAKSISRWRCKMAVLASTSGPKWLVERLPTFFL